MSEGILLVYLSLEPYSLERYKCASKIAPNYVVAWVQPELPRGSSPRDFVAHDRDRREFGISCTALALTFETFMHSDMEGKAYP